MKKETLKSAIDKIKFEISYFWNNSIMYRIRYFIQGVKNLWYWKSVIWHDRWWDYSYFHTILKHKLKDLQNHWHKDTHYVYDWSETMGIHRLVEILDEIEEIENSCTEHEKDIDKLYEEFGKILFERREFIDYYEDSDSGKIVERKSYTSLFRRLWD